MMTNAVIVGVVVFFILTGAWVLRSWLLKQPNTPRVGGRSLSFPIDPPTRSTIVMLTNADEERIRAIVKEELAKASRFADVRRLK
jgi:hypothetical protein